MKNLLLNGNFYVGKFPLLLLALTLSGCKVIGDILEAGVYSGIFLVVLIVGLVIFVIAMLNKKK